MKLRWMLSLVVWPVLALTALGQTEDILNLVPAEANAVAFINRMEQTDKAILALTQKINVPLPTSLVPGLQQMIGVNEQLNTKGTLGLIALKPQGGDIGAMQEVFLVPVNNYRRFLKELKAEQKGKFATSRLTNGHEINIASKTTPKGTYALIANKNYQGVLEKVLKSKGEVTNTLKSQLSWLNAVDAAIVFTKPGMDELVAGAQMGINQSRLFLDPTDEQQKLAIQMMDGVSQWLKTAEKNLTFLAIGAHLDKENNVTLGVRSGFTKGGTFATAAKDYNSLKGGPLAGLPNKKAFLAFGAILPKSYQKVIVDMVQMSSKMEKSKLTEAETKELLTIMKTLNRYDSLGTLITAPQDGTTSIMGNFSMLVKVPDSKAYLDYYEKTAKRSQELSAKMNPETANTKIAKLNGMKVDGVRLVQLVQKFDPQNEQEAQGIKMMFGDVKEVSSCAAAVDAKTLLITFGEPNVVAKQVKMIQSQKTSLVDQAEMKKLLAQLPEGAQWMATINPQHLMPYIENIGAMVNPGMPRLPAFPDTPPTGMGLKLSERGMEAELVVPIPLIENTASFFRKLQALQGI